jgi:hypothetical protein
MAPKDDLEPRLRSLESFLHRSELGTAATDPFVFPNGRVRYFVYCRLPVLLLKLTRTRTDEIDCDGCRAISRSRDTVLGYGDDFSVCSFPGVKKVAEAAYVVPEAGPCREGSCGPPSLGALKSL